MTNPTCIFIYFPSLCSSFFFFLFSFYFFLFFTSWQSKHKEDTSTTRPILLDEPELEVYPFLLHAFPLSRVTMCSFLFLFFFYFFFYISLFILPSSLLFSFFFFFRLTPIPFLFITLQVRRSPLPWAHLWRVSLMRQILWQRPWPLLLLLRKELLSRLQFLHLSPVLLRKVPIPRGLVSSLLFLPRLLLVRNESLLRMHLRLGMPLLPLLLLFVVVIPSLPSLRP